jgi:hypothetical protein
MYMYVESTAKFILLPNKNAFVKTLCVPIRLSYASSLVLKFTLRKKLNNFARVSWYKEESLMNFCVIFQC